MSPHLLLPLLLLSLAAGCSGVGIGPHRIDVQQGNALDADNLARLKPGLSRSQVRFLMGSPLLVDPFRNDRWDYVYVFHKAGKLTEQKRVSLFFEGDLLSRIEGDLPAAEQQPVAGGTPAVGPASVPEPAAVAAATADSAPPEAAAEPPAPSESRPEADAIRDQPGSASHVPAADAAPTPEQAVLAAVRAWADAWSRRDATAYFAGYGDDYRPQQGSRAEWEKRRRQRIAEARQIEVRIDSPMAEFAADGTAVVSFDQHYRSDSYRDAVRKQLRMVERDGRWLIVEERVVSNLGGKQP